MNNNWGHTFSAFYDEHKHFVFFNCYKYVQDESVCEDLTTEIFMELFQKPETMDQVKNFQKWLPIVTRNRCLRYLKKNKSNMQKQQEYFFYISDPSLQGINYNVSVKKEQKNAQKKLVESLYKCLNRLRDNHKKCIYLYYMQQNSYQQIMAATQYTFRQVDNYLYYGKQKLKLYLLEDGWTHNDFKQLFNDDLS